MDGQIDAVLDGGLLDTSRATTVDITKLQWRLIREGAIPQTAIEECLSPQRLDTYPISIISFSLATPAVSKSAMTLSVFF